MPNSHTYLGIDHLGLAVHELEAATQTYRDILGFSITGEETLEDRGLRVRFAETGNSRIELLAPTREDSQISKFLAQRGEGLHHICLRVKDIHASVEALRKKNVRIVGNAPEKGAHNTLVAFIHPKDSHGVLLELVQYPSDQA